MSSDTSVGGVVARREPGLPARFRSLDMDTDTHRPPRSRKRRRPGTHLPGRLRLAWSAPLSLAGRPGLDDDTAHAAGVLLAMANSPVSSERREAERKVSCVGSGGGEFGG